MLYQIPKISNELLLLFSISFGYETGKTLTNLRENKQGTKLRSNVPNESRVCSEPFNIAFVAAVEEDRCERRSTEPVIGIDEVALREFGKIGEAEVVKLL